MSGALFVQLLISTHRLTSLFPVPQSRFLSNKSTSEPFAKKHFLDALRYSKIARTFLFFFLAIEKICWSSIFSTLPIPQFPSECCSMLFSVTQSQSLKNKYSSGDCWAFSFSQYFFKSNPVSFLPPDSWSNMGFPWCSCGLQNVNVRS